MNISHSKGILHGPEAGVVLPFNKSYLRVMLLFQNSDAKKWSAHIDVRNAAHICIFLIAQIACELLRELSESSEDVTLNAGARHTVGQTNKFFCNYENTRRQRQTRAQARS